MIIQQHNELNLNSFWKQNSGCMCPLCEVVLSWGWFCHYPAARDLCWCLHSSLMATTGGWGGSIGFQHLGSPGMALNIPTTKDYPAPNTEGVQAEKSYFSGKQSEDQTPKNYEEILSFTVDLLLGEEVIQ